MYVLRWQVMQYAAMLLRSVTTMYCSVGVCLHVPSCNSNVWSLFSPNFLCCPVLTFVIWNINSALLTGSVVDLLPTYTLLQLENLAEKNFIHGSIETWLKTGLMIGVFQRESNML